MLLCLCSKNEPASVDQVLARGVTLLRSEHVTCSRVAPLLMPATAPKWRGALRQSYQANGGLLYKTNFLTPASYEAVRDECRSLRRHFKRELDSIATGRLGCCLDSRSQAHLNLMTRTLTRTLTLTPSPNPKQ